MKVIELLNKTADYLNKEVIIVEKKIKQQYQNKQN